MCSQPDESPELLLTVKRFRVVRHRQKLPDGTTHERETVQHPGAVVILPILDDGRVCLLRNYRVAVNETLVELPAGTLEPNEPPLFTAKRELAEETGYQAEDWEPMAEFLMSPGILNERMHLFLARRLQPGPQQLEAGEQIEILLVSLDDALAMVDDGRINDAKTMVALLLYDRRHR